MSDFKWEMQERIDAGLSPEAAYNETRDAYAGVADLQRKARKENPEPPHEKNISNVSVRFEREQIEVTMDGSLPPFKADYARKFIPGLTTVYVTVDGVNLAPMTPEEFESWKKEQ